MPPVLPAPARSRRPRPDPVRALALGDLAAPYDLDLLLRAFSIVARCSPRARLVVAGEGRERGALQARVAFEGIEDVVSLPGALAPARAAELLQRADVFVLALRPGGSAAHPAARASLAAAMASGLCVVATEDAYTAGHVEDGRNGLLVEAGDLPALARALNLAVSNVPLRRSLGEAAASGVRVGTRRSA
jgi:glycosyltransferase involved in cell wall biosynthesis